MDRTFQSKYTISFIKKSGIIVGSLFTIGIALILVYPSNSTISQLLTYVICFLMFVIAGFCSISINWVTVIVKDTGIVWKRIDKTVELKWEEIKKVERLLRPYSGVLYNIVTSKGRFKIPTTIKNYQDLFKEIENHTGKKIKWGL